MEHTDGVLEVTDLAPSPVVDPLAMNAVFAVGAAGRLVIVGAVGESFVV
jgi:hypothetical protein